jgi:ABC-type lipoprotein release transport system permease subunit
MQAFAAVFSWFRIDLRRRWRSLLVLALLIALAAGTVMTTVAGARRGATAADRLLEQTLPGTIVAQPNQPGFDWNAVRALPEVAALGTFALTDAYVIDEIPRDAEPAGYPPADDEVMRTIERPVVLEGRLPDLSRADEVVVGPTFRDTFGLGVGDTLTLRLYAPETLDELAFLDAAEVEPDGPTVETRIVGVVRSPAQLLSGDEGLDTEGGLLTSPGLFTQYAPNFLGASGEGIVNAIIRLDGGEAAIADFKAGLEQVSGRSDIGIWNLADEARHVRDVTGFESDALLVFALMAGIAAVFLVGQAVARHAAATVADLGVLRAAGMTPRQSVWAGAFGPLLAAVAGAVVGAAGAAVASRWFPIGTASLYEPDPGFDLDLPVLVAGAIVVSLLVAIGAAGAARAARRSAWAAGSPRSSTIATAVGRTGASVPVVVGTGFALEPGRGRQTVPVRPALVGSVVGVLGVVAAFTFSAGVEDAASHPERFGQVHQLDAFLGFEGEDFGPVDQVLPMVAADPDVVAVNDARIAIAEVGHVPVTLYTLDPVDAPWEPVLIEGRVPEGPAEVALAPGSAEAIGVAVGDVVRMTGTLGVRELTVSGLAFVPEFPSHNDYVTGGWVTAAGYDELFDADSELSPAFKFRLAYVALEPASDPGTVATRIEAATGAEDLLTPPEPPSPLGELRQVRRLPVFLAGFMAVLALGAVGHALATAVRRRRHDVAVLRAVGMTRTQSRGVVVTQASVLALVGLLVGVPLGVALGRTVWRYVADTMPLFYVPPVALLALLLIVPVALLAANLLAAWPSHRAASMRVGHVLRAE